MSLLKQSIWSVTIVALAFLVLLIATEPRVPEPILEPPHALWVMPTDTPLPVEEPVDLAWWQGKIRDPFKPVLK